MSRPIPTAPCFRVTIPGAHPPTCNQLFRGKLHDRIRLSKQWRVVVALACKAAGVARATCKRRVTITIVLGPGSRGADPDSFFKATHDALKHAGALVGDSDRWLEIARPVYERGPQDATAIVLEDLP